MNKWILLVIIFLMGILGTIRCNKNIENMDIDWQCPSTLGICPAGCEAPDNAEYECSKKITYEGPGECSIKCSYICKDKESCVKNECCKNCGSYNIPINCGVIARTI